MPYKLDFTSESPAWTFYQFLKKEGKTDRELDVGCHKNDYSKPGPNAIVVNKTRVHEECEILEYVAERYEKYRALIEETQRRTVSIVIDDPELIQKSDVAIQSARESLKKSGLRPNTDAYNEKLAAALFYFADFPANLEKIKRDDPVLLDRTSELEKIGLSGFRDFLFTHGGLGTITFASTMQELTADSAVQQQKGECTEKSKVLYALFRQAELKPQFVRVLNREMRRMIRAIGLPTVPGLEDTDHMAVSLNFGNRTRIFDLQLFNSDALFREFYPLTILQFFAAEKINRAQELGSLNQDARAADELNESIRSEPDSAMTHASLCRLHLDHNRLEEAQLACEQAVRLEPATSFALVSLGLVHVARQEWTQAETNFRAALRSNPYHADSQVYLADALMAQGKLEEAVESFERAILMIPNPAYLLYKQALCYLTLGRLDVAENRFRRSVKLDTDNLQAFLMLGVTLWRKGDHAAARKSWEDYRKKALAAIQAGHAPAAEVLNWTAGGIDNTPQGLKEDAASLKPLADLFHDLETLLREKGMNEKAAEASRIASELDPGTDVLTLPAPDPATTSRSRRYRQLPQRVDRGEKTGFPKLSIGPVFGVMVDRSHLLKEARIPANWRERETGETETGTRGVEQDGGGVRASFRGEFAWLPFRNPWVRHTLFGEAGYVWMGVKSESRPGYEPTTDVDSSNLRGLLLTAGSGLMLHAPNFRPFANFVYAGMDLAGNRHLPEMVAAGQRNWQDTAGFELGLEISFQTLAFGAGADEFGRPRSPLTLFSGGTNHEGKQRHWPAFRISWTRLGGSDSTNLANLGMVVYWDL